ncbi:MAG: adenylyltransferase/cytidyltransferase family protein [Candidatus Nanoarchaeia archaeon]|nr:adenylyltransferase/cytidyltransferase family protein [Candidatus Nanoarchaeia archaeon]
MQKALIIGRFQPFHKGHEFLINQVLKQNYSIIIAIGSSQESRTAKNPFNYEERKKMIQSCFKNAKIMPSQDYESDEDWADDLMSKAKFDIVYSNNEKVNEIFYKRKIQVKKVNELPNISGTKIRKMINNNDNKYKELIPKSCLEEMEKICAMKIIKECFKIKK